MLGRPPPAKVDGPLWRLLFTLASKGCCHYDKDFDAAYPQHLLPNMECVDEMSTNRLHTLGSALELIASTRSKLKHGVDEEKAEIGSACTVLDKSYRSADELSERLLIRRKRRAIRHREDALSSIANLCISAKRLYDAWNKITTDAKEHASDANI
jgi:SMC interacting uncharacterized protein involved in chromosome segregation